MTGQQLDLVVLGVYVLLATGVGLALRGRPRTAGDYFLGSGRIHWRLVLLSIVATETSTVTFLSVPGVAYTGDLTFLQLPLGYIVGRTAVAVWLVPQLMAGERLTLYETLGARFGDTVQKLTSALFIVTRTLADGLRLYLTAIVVQAFTGWSFAGAILALGIATLVYTFLGGLRAVVWTDSLQLVVYLGGAAIAGWILLGRIDGGAAGVWQAASEASKLRIFDFALDFTKPFTFWSGVIGGAFLSAASHGADQMMVQRYLATGAVAPARRALVWSSVVVLVQFALFLALGLGLWVFYQGVPFDSPDQVFSRFIVEELPAGLRGLIVAAALSAAMSTLSSSLNAVASAIVGDFVRPGATRGSLWLARWLAVAAGVAQMLVAWISHLEGAGRSTVLAVITVAAFTTGLTLGLLTLARAVPRAGRRAALGALVCGAVAVTTVWATTSVAGPWYALIGSVATFGSGWLFARS